MDCQLLEDVFGISRDVPLNYTPRNHVDDRFIESLSRKQHIVIYGGSRQGKTCLIKKCLSEDFYIKIQCSNKLDISDINKLILKQAGFKFKTSDKKTTSSKAKTSGTAGFKIFAKAEIEGSYEKESAKEMQESYLELDLADVNDVIKALKSLNFSKFIILEDFHYLKKETQIDIAFALKSYYEASNLLFIIVGVWLEENRLIALNGDLGGRIVSINADLWRSEDLNNVILSGCSLLNIEFDKDLIESIILESYDNVYFVQEICYRVCKKFNILKTLDNVSYSRKNRGFYEEKHGEYIETGENRSNLFLVKQNFDITLIVRQIIDQLSARYHSFLLLFSEGFNDEDKHELHKWLLYPLIISDNNDIEKNLTYTKLKKIIKENHPDGKKITTKMIMKTAKSINTLQQTKRITPNVIEYDETTFKINIVDKGLNIWLEYQQKEELLSLLDLPC